MVLIKAGGPDIRRNGSLIEFWIGGIKVADITPAGQIRMRGDFSAGETF